MPAVSRPRSGPRRDESARLDVLHAADDLLAEVGFAALTVEAIARRAGVAKQTIYRWWPSKVEILLDTLIEDSAKRLTVPGGTPTAADVRDYLGAFAAFLTDDPAGKVYLALLAQAQHDSRTASVLHDRYLSPRRARERAMLSAGAFTLSLDPDVALDALLGPIVFRALTGSPTPASLLDALVRDTLRPLA